MKSKREKFIKESLLISKGEIKLDKNMMMLSERIGRKILSTDKKEKNISKVCCRKKGIGWKILFS